MDKNWQKTDKKRNEQIMKMRKDGKSYRVLGRIFHISHTRVKAIIDNVEKRKLLDKGIGLIDNERGGENSKVDHAKRK